MISNKLVLIYFRQKSAGNFFVFYDVNFFVILIYPVFLVSFLVKKGLFLQ